MKNKIFLIKKLFQEMINIHRIFNFPKIQILIGIIKLLITKNYKNPNKNRNKNYNLKIRPPKYFFFKTNIKSRASIEIVEIKILAKLSITLKKKFK